MSRFEVFDLDFEGPPVVQHRVELLPHRHQGLLPLIPHCLPAGEGRFRGLEAGEPLGEIRLEIGGGIGPAGEPVHRLVLFNLAPQQQDLLLLLAQAGFAPGDFPVELFEGDLFLGDHFQALADLGAEILDQVASPADLEFDRDI
jgi:hypothetical protein